MSAPLPAVASSEPTSCEELLRPTLAGEHPPTGRHGLSSDRSAYFETHRLRANEADCDGSAFPSALANMLQEAACGHVVAFRGRSDTGMAIDPIMLEMGLIFVMARLQMEIQNYPAWGDLVQVETYFQENGRLAARRDWNVINITRGEVVARATSNWVIIDDCTRRLVRIPPAMRDIWVEACPNPPRFAVAPDTTKDRCPEIEQPYSASTSHAPPQAARRTDMDLNGHINNVAYLSWALESIPSDLYYSKHMTKLVLEFKNECVAGDIIRSVAQPDGDTSEGGTRFAHSVLKCTGDSTEELIRCSTEWA